MEFPQDKFFRKTRSDEAAFVQIMFRRFMWVLVLISLWVFGSYIALAMVWMVLGAVINPTAFLPYAAGASTFVTVITTKYNEFMNLAENGMKKVIEFIKGLTSTQLNEMLKKMGVSSDSTSGASNSDTVEALTAQATSLGIAENIYADPTDSAAYVAEVRLKMQEKCQNFIKEKMDKILKPEFNHLKDILTNVIISILKQDTDQLKTDLHDLLYNMNGNGVEGKIFVMPEGLINLLWEFSFISDVNISSEDFLVSTIDPIAGLIMDQLVSKDYYASYDLNKDALNKMINMIISLEKGETSNVVQHLTSMIEKVDYFKPLKEHMSLFNIAINLLDGNKMNYHQLFKLLKGFIKEMKLESEFVDFFELFLNSFNCQAENPSIREMNMIIERFVRKTMAISEDNRKNPQLYKEFKESVRGIAYNLTMLFAFLYHEFDGLSKEIVRTLIEQMKEVLPSYFKEPKVYKNIVPIIQAGYKTIACFLDNPNQIISQFESNASSFGISKDAAHQIKVMSTIKYKEMYPGKEIYKVQNLQIWKDITATLQINKNLLMGLFGFITLRFEDINEINDLVTFMMKLGKVDIEQRSKTLDIFKLYASDSESDISTSATNLGIPRQFIPLILIAKGILDPKFVTDFEWIELGLDTTDNKLLDDRYSVFYDEKKFEKWRNDVSAKLAKVNDKIMEGNVDGPAKKTLLMLSCHGPITKKQIKEDLDTLSTNKNKIAQFTEYQFELLTSMINSRAINRNSTTGFDSDSKTGISELAKAINLEEAKLDKLLTLWFLTRADKICNVIKDFSPYFIEEGHEEDYESYISYVYSKMKKIADKEDFIKNEFGKVFKLNVPSVILNKSIFNSNAPLDLNSMYEMISYPLNSLIRQVDNKIYYRDYDECLISLTPLIKYLSSHMEVQHTMLIRKIFNIEHEGVADLLSILNETSQTNSISLFIDHLDKYCGESMKLFVALLAFFQGKATNVEITNSELKKVSIKQYLSELFYPELLDAMYGLFMQEAHDYSDYLIKFFRRVEACKAVNTANISLQSLVKIPSMVIDNFLKLLAGQDYNAKVLSKELGLSSEAIEFGSGLTRIMNIGDNYRSDTIISVCNNNDFKSALSKINVKTGETLSIFKIMYGCYDNDDIKWIIESLNLDKDKIGEDENIIKSILALDQVLDINDDANKNWVKIQKRTDIAQTLIDSMGVDKEMVQLASVLLHGDFSVLKKISVIPTFQFLFPKSHDILPDYLEFLMGICGTISHRVTKFSINDLFRQYYKNLEKKNPPISATDADYMTPNSSRSYAVFCLYKSLDISPIWTFLFLGDISVWDYIWELYYFNKNYKDPFLNPLVILMIVMNYCDTPTVFKEIMSDMEYLKNYSKLLEDPTFKNLSYPNPDRTQKNLRDIKMNQDPQILKDSWKGYRATCEGLTSLLWANWAKSKDKLEELTKKHFQRSEVLNYWPNKDKFFTDSQISEALKQAALASIRKKIISSNNKSVDDFCVKAAASSLPLENFLNNYEDGETKDIITGILETIFPDIITNTINSVSDILEDPRDTEEEKKINSPWALPKVERFFEDRNGQEFTMCTLATIVEIRNGFYSLHEIEDHGEDHYKLFTYKLDVLLSMIEKNTFNKSFMSSFSKYRVMQLVGLSAGFCIRGEDMIRANVTAQINDIEFQKEYDQVLFKYKDGKEDVTNKRNFFIMIAKLKRMWNVAKNFAEARDKRYFRAYNLNTLETAIENENYYEINTEPENVISGSFPSYTHFYWLPFLYDVPTCNTLMDFNYEDFYFEGDIASSRLQYIQSYLKDSHNDVYDIRSGANWKDVVLIQNKFNLHFDSNEYLLLVSIFRGHYPAIQESNTYFTIRYAEITPYLYGLLGLNASANNINENNIFACENYIASCGQGLASNRKSLIEIVKFLYASADTIKKFSSAFGDNEQVFEHFMKLSASTLMSKPEIDSAEFLISKISGLTNLEIEVFKKIMEVSNGATTYLDELIEYSKKKKGLTDNAADAMSNLINNLDIYGLRSVENLNPESFNLRDKTSYSINIQKNNFYFYLELFKIAIFQYPDNIPNKISLINIENCDMFGEKGDKDDRTEEQTYNIKNRDRLTLLFTVINNILDGDFSVFFVSNEENFFEVLRILHLANNPKDLKTLRVVASLKPNKLNAKFVKNKPEDLDLKRRAEEFKELKIICLPEGLENKEELEGKLSSLIIGMQYWNIVEIQKGLECRDEKSSNAELSCLLKSFYVWKNLGLIISNWDNINGKDSKGMNSVSAVDSKVIGSSLKVFLGKILQCIRKVNQAKLLKKTMNSPTKPGAASQIAEENKIMEDQNYNEIKMDVLSKPHTLTHGFVNLLNKYRNKGKTSHYLDWMMSLSSILPSSSKDPCSLIEPFFTGRYLNMRAKKENEPCLSFVLNFSLQSYTLLFGKQKQQKNKNVVIKDNKPEESTQINIGPLSSVQSLPTCINLLKSGKNGEEPDELRMKNLMIFDLFMRLGVVLQKRKKDGSSGDLIVSLGVFKMVLSKMQFEKIDLIYDIINLLTGYDISTKSITANKSINLLATLFKVLNEAFLEKDSIRPYLNEGVLKELNKNLTMLSDYNVKTLTDPKFQSTVIDLLCAITGTNRELVQLTKDPKKKKGVIKSVISKLGSILGGDKEDKIDAEDEIKPVLLELQITEIEAIFKLSQFDISYMNPLLERLDCDTQKIRLFFKTIETVKKWSVFGKSFALQDDEPIAKAKAGESELAEIVKRIQDGTATTHEVFVATDRDGDSSGSISKQEFSALARRLNINLTDHRVNEIFAALKKGSSGDNDEELNEEEFGEAIQYLSQKNTNMTLEALGISKSMLMVALVSLIIILFLLFVFIFLGIQGFAVGSSFGSVVNSLIPMGAGAGVGGGTDEEKEKQTSDESVGSAVEKSQTILQSNSV